MALISNSPGGLPLPPSSNRERVAAAPEAVHEGAVDRVETSALGFAPVEISGAQELAPATLEKLQATAQRAVEFFQERFGTLSRPIKLDVSAHQKALRTGYNTETDTVCFPRLKHIKNSGLDSVDVINHELFHAMMYQAYPQDAGTDLERARLHEALADYFAYQLNPDERFGEGYSTEKEQLRFYKNDLAISLATGPHAQGNALSSLLIKNQVSPEQVHKFLSQGEFSLAGMASISPAFGAALERDASFQLIEQASPYPSSVIHRYRIRDDQPLELTFVANQSLKEAHPDLSVRWLTPEGIPSQHYVITSSAPDRFSVAKPADAPMEKMVAFFYDDEKLVGARPFYFGPETGEAPQPQ